LSQQYRSSWVDLGARKQGAEHPLDIGRREGVELQFLDGV